MAGFNPAEPRAAGKWTTGGAQGAQATGPKMSPKQFQALQNEKVALEAEAKRLRALIAQAKAGVHRGQAGAHKTAKGTKASASRTSKVAAAKGAVHHAKAPNLLQQVVALRKTVAKLRVEWAQIQRRKK